MTLQLGFFTDFKWSDSVLLTGTPSDIENLSSVLGQFIESPEQQLPIHKLATIAPSHPVQLFAQRISQKLVSPNFTWLCTHESLPDIQAKLLALVHSSNGHQYFDLEGSDVQLIVSVGEYSDSWWQAHG